MASVLLRANEVHWIVAGSKRVELSWVEPRLVKKGAFLASCGPVKLASTVSRFFKSCSFVQMNFKTQFSLLLSCQLQTTSKFRLSTFPSSKKRWKSRLNWKQDHLNWTCCSLKLNCFWLKVRSLNFLYSLSSMLDARSPIRDSFREDSLSIQVSCCEPRHEPTRAKN